MLFQSFGRRILILEVDDEVDATEQKLFDLQISASLKKIQNGVKHSQGLRDVSSAKLKQIPLNQILLEIKYCKRFSRFTEDTFLAFGLRILNSQKTDLNRK